ncbi:MAG: HdeD family acid-resistance protein [Candidatus Scatomorpha sp.]|jgi:uncharacterized membrane protein HdeD (DUF308 family)
MAKNIKEVKDERLSVKPLIIKYAAAIMLIGLGAAAIAWTTLSLNTLCIIIGSAAVVFGIIMIIVYSITPVMDVGKSGILSIGMLCVVIGAILLIRPKELLGFIQVIAGLLLILDSVFKIQAAIDAKRLELGGWWTLLLMSLLALAMGIVMVLGIGADMIIIMLGASLILDGLQNLIHAIFSTAHRQRLVRLYKKALEEQIAEETAALEAQKAEEILPPEPSETPEVLEKAELSEPEEVPVPEEIEVPQPEEVEVPQPEEIEIPQPEEIEIPQPEEEKPVE